MAANSRLAMATHIMVGLGYLPDHSSSHQEGHWPWVSSGLLAKSINTNPVVVRRMLLDLKKAGLVKALEGKGGGVALAKPPDQITLLDILKAVGGETLFSFNPNPPNKDCPVSVHMYQLIEPVFFSVSESLEASLGKTSLSDLIAGIP